MSRNLWFAEVFIAECDDVGLVQTFSIQKLPIFVTFVRIFYSHELVFVY